MTSFDEQREAMVRRQIAGRGIHNEAILKAMRAVPREAFVSAESAAYAYGDGPLPIGEGQTISQPFIVAMMIEAIDPQPDDRVLEVGAGSGYAAAVLSRIVREVYAIERHETLAQRARERLAELGYDNVHIRCGDGSRGWPEKTPFDGIIVSAAGPVVPESLRDQLSVGGRLVIPIGGARRSQKLLRIERTSEHEFRKKSLGGVRFVPLVGQEGWSGDNPTFGRGCLSSFGELF